MHRRTGSGAGLAAALLALGALGALALVSGCSGARKPFPAEPIEQRVTVHVKKFEFVPATIRVRAGRQVALRFKSDDASFGVRIPELGLAVTVPSRGASRLVFTPRKPGLLSLRCAPPGPEPGCSRMRGTIIVGR